MAPLCISGLGWSGECPAFSRIPSGMAALKPFVHTLPLAPACAIIARSSLHATHPPFASTRLIGYGYVSATSRLPPTCERIRHHLHVDGRAYELLAGLSLTLFRCARRWSRTTAHLRFLHSTRCVSPIWHHPHSCTYLPPCTVVRLFLACKKVADRVTGHLRAMPATIVIIQIVISEPTFAGGADTLTG